MSRPLFTYAIVPLSCIGILAAQARGSDIRPDDVVVLRSDARSIVLEFRPRFSPPVTIPVNGRDFILYDFQGAAAHWKSSTVGAPDIRFRSAPLAFPSSQGNTVLVIAADYEDLQGSSLAPVPLVRVQEDLTGERVYDPDPRQYASDSFVPAAPAEIGTIGRSRDLLLGGVKFYPIQFKAASRTVRRYSRIVVEVTYGPPDAALPPRDPLRLLASVPLNYNIARAWVSAAKVAAPDSSVLASGEWYRLAVTGEGMYRLDASYLSAIGVNVTAIDPRTIRIYGNGGTEVPENPLAPRISDLRENAIYVAGEGDGHFDAGDYVVFYGRGVRGWSYDSGAKTWRHYINHYGELNYYWLNFGGTPGKRMGSKPSLPSSAADVVRESFTDAVAVEDERANLLGSGKDWLGQSVAPGGSFTYMTPLPGLVQGARISYRYRLVSQSDGQPSFTVRENGVPIGSHGMGAIYGYAVGTSGTFQASGTSTLPSGASQLNFQYSSSSLSAMGWVDWFEILYPRRLWGVNDVLGFRGPDTTAVVEYRLQQFASEPMVFDVTTHEDVKLVTGVAGSFLFRAQETAGRSSAYQAVAGNGWRQPAGAFKISNENLRGYAEGADFIIVTSTADYGLAAQALKTYRENPAHGGLKTYVADLNQIYNEFGGGIPDITAIRDFLKYAYDNWSPRPGFVLMLGEASYDYKGLLGAKSSYVPTWQSGESLDDVLSSGTDDFYAKFGTDDRPSLVLGRVSARTSGEAGAFVDKLRRYEEGSALDSWKMRMLYIGDDAWTPEGGEIGDRTIHTQAMETLAVGCTPEEFEKKKIYIAEYPTVFSAQGRRKPGAYQDIIDQINQGVLVANFAGHGNPTQIAHENIFNVATSIPQLTNSDNLTVFFLATCNFSQFDDPKRYTGSEILINKSDGGSIAVVSASRKVYADANALLNQETFKRMFTRDALGRVVVERPATSLFLFKVAFGNGDNDQKFFFMGDPTMRLQFPRRYATVDSINGQSVDSAGGTVRVSPIQLRSLSRVTVSGSVRDAANSLDAGYNGRVSLTINDATRLQTIVNFYPGANFSYVATGGTIYRGENSVKNGRFSATFLVPKDIQYADTTARGRLTAYLSRPDDRAADGEAYTANIRIGGTDSSAVNDGKGPAISIYLGNRSFRPGDVVGAKTVLFVDLADSSGINTSVSGIGHRIEAWVNNASEGQDLTGFYASKLDNYREGAVQYSITDLPQGKNTIRVRAWDSFNNSATAETDFQVESADGLSVTDVFNYPNPFGGEGTSFTFRQNQSSPLTVSVKIFTLAGRLIRTLDAPASGDSFVRVPWDGRDRDGDVIANGVYLYKLIVKTADGRYNSEILGKLSKVQ